MSNVIRKMSCLMTVVSLCLALVSTGQAITVTWDNGAGDMAWGTSQGGANLNWDADVSPSTGDDVDITTGDTVNYGTPLYGVGTELLDLDLSGAGTTLNISADFHMGNNTAINPLSFGTGTTITHSAGTVDIDSSAASSGFFVAGTYNLSGGSIVTDGRIAVSSGTLNVASGSVDNNGDILHFTGSSTGLINFTGGTFESEGGPWFGGEFAFTGSSGGLIYDVTGGDNIVVGNGSGASMTLSVLGSPLVNTIASNNVNVLFNDIDGIFEATVNSTTDKFLRVTEGGDITLGGTLIVSNLSGSEYGVFDLLSVVGGGAITGDFETLSLPFGWSILDDGSLDGTFTVGQLLPVPEPSSFLVLSLGALGLVRHTRRRRLKA